MHSLFLLSLLLATIFHLSRGANPLNVTFPENPPASALVNVVDDNFFGISLELSALDTLWGETVDTIPDAMQNYLYNIAVRMSKPLRIRIGGNSMDGATYNSSLTDAMLVISDLNANYNDIPTTFGPVLFDIMNAMYDKVGAMLFTIGLSMRDPMSANVLELAQAASQNLGSRLDAMLLGNEPDLYSSHGNRPNYTMTDYISDIGNVTSEFQSANLLQNPLLGGPSFCCDWYLTDLFKAGFNKYPYKYYTLQHYPRNICAGPNSGNTNISYFTSHMNVGPFLSWQQAGINEAKAAGVPVCISEFNSVSCGGSNISSTFGAALWAVDVGLKAASTNYSATYIHTREYGVTYNLFDPPVSNISTDPNWHTGANYYAALFMSEVFSSNGSVVVDLNVDNSNTSPQATVAAYGIYDQGGKTRGKLALMNYADQVAQPFVIPGGVANSVQFRTLTAPSVLEKANISWAGQTIGTNGTLQGNQLTTTVNCQDGCTVDVPGPGITLVILGSEVFFTGSSVIGNSTSAGTSTAGRTAGTPVSSGSLSTSNEHRLGLAGVTVGLLLSFLL